MNKITRTVTIAAIGALGAFGLVACGSDTKTTPAGTVTPSSNATGSTMTDESMAPGSTEAMTDESMAPDATEAMTDESMAPDATEAMTDTTGG